MTSAYKNLQSLRTKEPPPLSFKVREGPKICPGEKKWTLNIGFNENLRKCSYNSSFFFFFFIPWRATFLLFGERKCTDWIFLRPNYKRKTLQSKRNKLQKFPVNIHGNIKNYFRVKLSSVRNICTLYKQFLLIGNSEIVLWIAGKVWLLIWVSLEF